MEDLYAVKMVENQGGGTHAHLVMLYLQRVCCPVPGCHACAPVLQDNQTVAISLRPFIQVFLVGIARGLVPVVAPFEALVPLSLQACRSLSAMSEGFVLNVKLPESFIALQVVGVSVSDNKYGSVAQFGKDRALSNMK